MKLFSFIVIAVQQKKKNENIETYIMKTKQKTFEKCLTLIEPSTE